MFKSLGAKLMSNRGEVATSGDKTGAKGDGTGQGTDKSEPIIADLDFSDVPENIRKDVEKYTAQKTKQYDAGFRTKTEEYSKRTKELEDRKEKLRDLERLNEEIRGNPEMEKAVTKAINDVRAGKSSKIVSKDLKIIDQLIEKTDDSTVREDLKRMRDIINEETGSSALIEKITQLEKEIASIKTTAGVGVHASILAQRSKLEDSFGKELVKDNWDRIEAMALKHTSYVSDNEFPKLLYMTADASKIKSALLEQAKKKETEELDRKKRGSSFDGNSTVNKIEPKRDKSGKVVWSDLFNKMKEAGKFSQVP